MKMILEFEENKFRRRLEHDIQCMYMHILPSCNLTLFERYDQVCSAVRWSLLTIPAAGETIAANGSRQLPFRWWRLIRREPRVAMALPN
ncbi:hypothetical protein GWI33_011938 [Rhynchophorus ferrugineus]|uniref:Uncharacterized protein n=1 Tax=Rhynchophorus ferrugineus TaxID=354439 RepID=A0A834J1F2_RHYFE|nr:hypothetical protein GWI33_011938 [Rhynchophorus ferrugineus]